MARPAVSFVAVPWKRSALETAIAERMEKDRPRGLKSLVMGEWLAAPPSGNLYVISQHQQYSGD